MCLDNSMNISSAYGSDLRLKSTAFLFQVICFVLEMELEPRLATQLRLFLVIWS